MDMRKGNSDMQKVVIFVGPDRCGKTNIINAVSQRLQIPKFKASNEHEIFCNKQSMFIDALRHADFRTADLLKQTGHSVLFDRQYPCEWVYSLFFKRQTDLCAIRKLDTMYASMGAKIIFCTRKSFDGIVDDLNPKLAGDSLMQISNLYDGFCFGYTDCETLKVFVDDEDLDRELSEIIPFINGETK